MVDHNKTYEQVYNVREDKTLLSQVASVVCVLQQRGLVAMGFSAQQELLTIHATGSNPAKPVWEIDFFEHLFATEPLLAAKDRIKGVFICSHKQLIVPDELYDEATAQDWLKRLFFTEPNEAICITPLKHNKAQYLLSAPTGVTELVKINFKQAVILPLAAYQFLSAHNTNLALECCLAGGEAVISLHNFNQLLWHNVITYTGAADIAFEVNHYCRENNIAATQLTVTCNATTAADHTVLEELASYFTNFTMGDGAVKGQWGGATSLANQLLACV